MRSIRLLHLRHVRAHPLRSAIAVIAVASGVALAVTTAVVQTSTSRSFERYAQSFAGPAEIRIIGPVDRGGLNESMTSRVEAVDGVRAAIPLIQAVALADGAKEKDIPIVALGYDCRATELVGDFACEQSAIESARTYVPPLISASLAKTLGPDAFLRTNDGPKPLRGATTVDALDDVNDGRIVALPIHVAQRLFTRPGTVDVIYAIPDEDAQVDDVTRRLSDVVGKHNNVLGRDELSPFVQFFTELYTLLAAVGLGTLATGAVLARNALALSLEDRRRDLAVAAAVGASPRTIVVGALAEGAVLGFVGGLVGACLGIAVAYPVLDGFQFFSERFAGLRMTVEVTPTPFITGALLGVVLGIVSAWRPARQASRLDVVAELRRREGPAAERRTSLRRGVILVGIGAAATALAHVAARGGGISPWQPVVGQFASLVAVVAFVSAITQFAPLAFSIGSRVRWRSAPIRLAWAHLVGDGWRSASLVLAAAGAVLAGFMIANLGRTVLGSLSDHVAKTEGNAVRVTTIPRSNTLSLDAKPSPGLARRVGAMEGVARVRREVGLVVAMERGFVLVEALDEDVPRHEVLRGAFSADAFVRGEAVIGPGLARREGVGPGDELRLPTRDGFVNVPVQAVVANGDTTGIVMTMTLEHVERLWGEQPPLSLVADPTPGTDPEMLARRIEEARLDPNLNALAKAELMADARRENARFFTPFWALQRALIVIAFAAVLSNLLLVALRRQRELGLVTAVGMSPGALSRMVTAEALAVGVAAVVLGSIAALASTEAFRKALFIMIPYPMPLRIDVAAPFVYGAITLFVLFLAAAWPAWRTSRLNVVEALRAE